MKRKRAIKMKGNKTKNKTKTNECALADSVAKLLVAIVSI